MVGQLVVSVGQGEELRILTSLEVFGVNKQVIMATLPLITSLRSSYLRRRHIISP